jgi:hypothetical protein
MTAHLVPLLTVAQVVELRKRMPSIQVTRDSNGVVDRREAYQRKIQALGIDGSWQYFQRRILGNFVKDDARVLGNVSS